MPYSIKHSSGEETHTNSGSTDKGLQGIDGINPKKFPVIVYLGKGDQDSIKKVQTAILKLFDVHNFAITHEDKAEYGSWWKRWLVKAQDEKTRKALRQRLVKIEKALELQHIGKTKASINKEEAEAAAALIESLKSENEAMIQVGSLLILKLTQPSGDSHILVKNLSDTELIAIEYFPEILKNPRTLLGEMRKIIAIGEYAKENLIRQQPELETNPTVEPPPELETNPAEGKKTLDKWTEVFKANRTNLKKQVDEGFKQAEKL